MENTIAVEVIPTKPGVAFAGGFYAGRFILGADVFALIVAPKAGGEIEAEWNHQVKKISGALSYRDGLANTDAMAKAGSELAQDIQQLRIGGHADWYLPSRLESLILFGELRGLKLFDTGAEAFERDWYWTSTQSASYGAFAWSQSFYYGYQLYNYVSSQLRARAVRRLKL